MNRPWVTAAVAGLLAFTAVATVASAFLATLQGTLSPAAAAAGLGLGLVLAVVAARGCFARRADPAPSPRLFDTLALAVLGLACLRQFLGLCFERDGIVYTLLGYNYGDLPLHWTYVRNFASGGPFWPENPIFTGERLRYPFGVDLLTALLVRLDLPLPGLLRGMGLVASGLLAVTLFRWGRGFAVAAFLFSGGLAGLRLLAPGASDPPELAWKNLLLALYVPQRGFLFALPAGLLLLASWRGRLFRGERGLPVWVEGLLWGTMPLFHLHTFLFLSLVFAGGVLASGRLSEEWPTLAWAFLPATWTVWQVTDGFRAASLVWWKPGWTIDARNPLVFLAVNFGLWPLLAALALTRAWRERSREHLSALALGLGFFAVLFFVMLAPWDWDNTKVMIWCYLLLLPSIDALVLRPLPTLGRAALLLALLLPGAVPVLAASRGRGFEVFEVEELEGVCRALEAVPPGARVAAAPTFNHPVALCGRPLVAGYAGHLWSHGIAAARVQLALEALLDGRDGWREQAWALHARYLFWGRREERSFPRSKRPWEAVAAPVVSGAWGRLYRLPE